MHLQLLVSINLHCYSGNHSPSLLKEMYKNMYCAVFLVQLLMGETGKESAGETLHCT